MDEQTRALRNLTYRLFVEFGRAPTAEEVAWSGDLDAGDVGRGWRVLHEAHALVVDSETGGLRMCNPFSAVPTAHRVRAGGRWWHANCAWDALGICAALHVDGRIETSCPDCADPIATELRGQRPADESLLFHCLVPASQWWDDIVFT